MEVQDAYHTQIKHYPELIEFLLKQDITVQYLVHKDLLHSKTSILDDLHKRLHLEGYGARIISKRDDSTFLWGNGLYSPKYTSTHYTLFLLMHLNIDPSISIYQESVLCLKELWPKYGLVRPRHYQDLCVSAMVLNMFAYAHVEELACYEIIDYILSHQFLDGGFNCSWQNKPKPQHSSLHTTLSVLEALDQYERQGIKYRLDEIKTALKLAQEFILSKQLFISTKTNQAIHPSFIVCSFPYHWRYDILRALDYFVSVNHPYDPRMKRAIELLCSRMDESGYMPVEANRIGLRHFTLEKARSHSGFNTHRMMRVLRQYANSI